MPFNTKCFVYSCTSSSRIPYDTKCCVYNWPSSSRRIPYDTKCSVYTWPSSSRSHTSTSYPALKEVVGWRLGVASADFISLSLVHATLLYLHSRIHACYSTFLIRLEHPPDTGVCKHLGNSPSEYRGATVWSCSIAPNNGLSTDKCYLDSVPRSYSRESDISVNTVSLSVSILNFFNCRSTEHF